MNYRVSSLFFGFTVWAMATLVFRYWGHFFFDVASVPVLLLFFVGTVPVLFFLVQGFFRYFGLAAGLRLESAVLMAVPGMFFDVLCLKFHKSVFPGMTLEQALVLGAWVLWAYAVLLFLGLVGNRLPGRV